MKTLIRILLISIPVVLSACEGDGGIIIPRIQKGFDLGKIYDFDMTECGCCGGYMITVEDGNYKFFADEITGPNALNLIDVKLPVYVNVKWSLKTGDCANGERIIVHELQLASR